MDKGLQQTCFQRRYTNGLDEKMLYIDQLLRKCSQNHNEITDHIHQGDYSKKSQIITSVEKLEPSYTEWECKMEQLFWKSLAVLQTVKQSPFDLAILFPVEIKTCPHKTLYTDVHSKQCSQQPKSGSNPGVFIDKWIKYCISYKGILISHKA